MNDTKLVPVEPTEEMVDAGVKAHDDYLRDNQSLRVLVRVIYEEMLEAAPDSGECGLDEIIRRWQSTELSDSAAMAEVCRWSRSVRIKP